MFHRPMKRIEHSILEQVEFHLKDLLNLEGLRLVDILQAQKADQVEHRIHFEVHRILQELEVDHILQELAVDRILQELAVEHKVDQAAQNCLLLVESAAGLAGSQYIVDNLTSGYSLGLYDKNLFKGRDVLFPNF